LLSRTIKLFNAFYRFASINFEGSRTFGTFLRKDTLSFANGS